MSVTRSAAFCGRGVELAAKHINEAGGVNGRRFVLSIEDDVWHNGRFAKLP
jgi:ABC-type branched-subunit amino acid transport system substrate-binding protein